MQLCAAADTAGIAAAMATDTATAHERYCDLGRRFDRERTEALLGMMLLPSAARWRRSGRIEGEHPK
jgi:hypothetical protein